MMAPFFMFTVHPDSFYCTKPVPFGMLNKERKFKVKYLISWGCLRALETNESITRDG